MTYHVKDIARRKGLGIGSAGLLIISVRLVGANALENAHAVMQGMRQDVSGCLAPRHQFAVVPDESVAIRHGHVFLPVCC